MCLMARVNTKNLDVSLDYTCNFLYFTSTIIHIKLTLLNTHKLIANGIESCVRGFAGILLVDICYRKILDCLASCWQA